MENRLIMSHSILTSVFAANKSGDMGKMETFAQVCMDEYDESGWKDRGYFNRDDISIIKDDSKW
jgi:hypothetical protein